MCEPGTRGNYCNRSSLERDESGLREKAQGADAVWRRAQGSWEGSMRQNVAASFVISIT